MDIDVHIYLYLYLSLASPSKSIAKNWDNPVFLPLKHFRLRLGAVRTNHIQSALGAGITKP